MAWAREDETPDTLISSSDAAIMCCFGTRHFVFMPVPSEIFVRRGSQRKRAYQRPNEKCSPSLCIYFDEEAISLAATACTHWIPRRKAVTQRNDGSLERLSINQGDRNRVAAWRVTKQPDTPRALRARQENKSGPGASHQKCFNEQQYVETPK